MSNMLRNIALFVFAIFLGIGIHMAYERYHADDLEQKDYGGVVHNIE